MTIKPMQGVVYKDSGGVWQGRYLDPNGRLEGYQIPIAYDADDARWLLAQVVDIPMESVTIHDGQQ